MDTVNQKYTCTILQMVASATGLLETWICACIWQGRQKQPCQLKGLHDKTGIWMDVDSLSKDDGQRKLLNNVANDDGVVQTVVTTD